MKSYDGCWTCRLRKKRCDEIQPVCGNCSALQITCHFGDEKPSWMDNGLGQKEKAEEVKREVKSAAARRRGTLPMDVLADKDAGLATGGLKRQSASTKCPPFHAEPTPDSSPGWASTHTQFSTTLSKAHPDSWNTLDRLYISNSSDREPGVSELDRRFMMFYFDHFFPFLFPFYQPLLLEGGRTWVMELVAGDQAMWHTTLCLSTYFVSVALDGTVSGPNVCKSLAWEKLLKQMGVTFMMLQRNLQEVASSNTQELIVKTSRIMGSIIQLQRFEISVGNFENCQKHLGAAITLFRQIFWAVENVIDRGELPTFYGVLNHMGRPLWAITSQQSGAWNSDQAAFRFYSALLIVDDIIASTCMEEPPRLREYHARLLTNGGSSDERPPLNLEDFIGCENWVMLQIGEIAALDAWKKSTKRAGRLDMMELVARASAIKQVLLGNLARLDAPANTPKTNWLGLFTLYNDQLPPMPGGCTAFVTRVWAHAALLYLSVVVSGWQPGSAAIRENVVRTLALLEQMPAPELLRTMVWPFCMVGCLAEPGEEYRFRVMADALVPHRLFGAARKALEIMENVWKCRGELAIDTDFAACVCSLGYMSLLV
ncbi:fungal-specific transcription factor domain-containing protein [Talaromyces proteolyticus]|uniref:Fungal-specific transcription factor domain-containing protein n=1 Tax=Talaromyces proteolyticus TaxID=1131652 RepID=A0AAD4Q511_9EURO|nr:fungal-specific transcription factor domain-containing protein [Talaromyces proteolyticus]KAH8703684.1 fungal-specific transcription factor domain-containing protein [Talaromyces proteolyticus]